MVKHKRVGEKAKPKIVHGVGGQYNGKSMNRTKAYGKRESKVGKRAKLKMPSAARITRSTVVPGMRAATTKALKRDPYPKGAGTSKLTGRK